MIKKYNDFLFESNLFPKKEKPKVYATTDDETFDRITQNIIKNFDYDNLSNVEGGFEYKIREDAVLVLKKYRAYVLVYPVHLNNAGKSINTIYEEDYITRRNIEEIYFDDLTDKIRENFYNFLEKKHKIRAAEELKLKKKKESLKRKERLEELGL